MPPVSTNVNDDPCHSAGWAITSRVVPGIAVTIERRVPVKRLNSVDLPTFGRPTNTTEGSGLGMKVRAAVESLCRGHVMLTESFRKPKQELSRLLLMLRSKASGASAEGPIESRAPDPESRARRPEH